MNTRKIETDAKPKFHVGQCVVTDTGFEGEIVEILPIVETFVWGKWIPAKEFSYRIDSNRPFGIVTETESEISAA